MTLSKSDFSLLYSKGKMDKLILEPICLIFCIFLSTVLTFFTLFPKFRIFMVIMAKNLIANFDCYS